MGNVDGRIKETLEGKEDRGIHHQNAAAARELHEVALTLALKKGAGFFRASCYFLNRNGLVSCVLQPVIMAVLKLTRRPEKLCV
jgi:hypothetical protein